MFADFESVEQDVFRSVLATGFIANAARSLGMQGHLSGSFCRRVAIVVTIAAGLLESGCSVTR